ncbi:MADS-box transcription factor [Striga asiatica]|uniref:MADS-box transcription factor n=1 Tax=Striga asiatica TaxID=4170 RepID=A0A5A7Q2E5_STRAF|nr:MADS-box transcription factor [Striga asiatica]
MGRVKLEIKKIENTTNRQVTFSKRRNGLIKKAYELSVLCDVDVALIMFSPSGRVSNFAGHKSIGEIMERYVNLPEHERGSPVSMIDTQVEEIQQEIIKCKCQLEDMGKKLRIYEGNPSEITSLPEVEYREQILEETLKQHALQSQYNFNIVRPSQVNLTSPNIDVNVLTTSDHHPDNVLEWIPARDPQVQILNFLGSNGLLPLRDHQAQHVDDMLSPSLTLFHAPSLNVYDHLSLNTSMEDDTQRSVDVNLSPWTHQLYSTGLSLS